MSKEKLGFIGLGTMGFAMCYGLYKSGYSMVLPTYRRQIDQSCSFIPLAPNEEAKTALYDEMLNNGCEGAADTAEQFAKSDFILISMPTSKQVEMNAYGEAGILENAKPGTIVIDLTSADPVSTRKICADAEKKGIDWLDCPISGGYAGATAQTLAVMVGGKQEAFEKAKPILETLGDPKKVTFVGPSGAGNTLKSVNNYLSTTCLLATTEGLMVAAKAGIDPMVAAKVINGGGGASNATSNKYPNYIFNGAGLKMTVDLMLKDVNLYCQAAKAGKVPAFLGNTVHQIAEIPSATGKGNQDWIEYVRLYEEWCGEKVIGIEK